MSASVEAFLNKLHHPALASIDLSLDRMHRLLAMLGSPQKRLPPVIHVAGTNGKGSLLAYLQAIFQAAGLKVHRYTSPHLVHFRERIILAGKETEDTNLENILRHMAPILAQQPATFFEATTAAAFLAFAERPADILLLETGLGGRLDATNVIEKPLLTAITPIAIDHAEYLGNTLAAIAGEKAGILKRDVPCIVGRQTSEAAKILEEKSHILCVPLYRLGKEWQVENGDYVSSSRRIKLNPSLTGVHQYDNAATAIACIEQTKFLITDAHIENGLTTTHWPARLQHLKTGKWTKALPQEMELWLDGGHNPQGGEILADWLKTRGVSAYLICGMTGNKDVQGYLTPLAPYVKALYAITIPNEASAHPAEKIRQTAAGLQIEAYASASLENALQSVAQRAKTPSIACICGSLYLAGKVLASNG